MSELRERAEELMVEAVKLARSGEVELSRKYVRLALTYVAKGRVRLPREMRRSYCRRCFSPLVLGLTESRRVKRKTLIRRCLLCGWVRRYRLRGQTEES
ncbi:ribonuclease P [Sulfodiicoccus acidiphilus]|uniref:Ribonuclease P protein component 4 n=1 Tax=Sulfodiicoccus acidiphilus TaxID=1670455 RepID=A0A348B1N4_9CREN|nr:hypothetical protein [Sulfodiicoccus acidiphilus]BBD72086.1 ribonuclease P [Sulfodiicoccus acidiphilus]GGU05049.1 ribonuclease P [Sulfodiicoccus acidiphilus]